MMKNKILLISTHYRISEKLFGVIPELSKFVDVDLYCVGQMDQTKKWDGDLDLRPLIIDKIRPFLNSIVRDVNISKYDAILYDDNRDRGDLGIHDIFKAAKHHDIPMVGNSHGNQEGDNYVAFNRCYDYAFCFGEFEYEKLSKASSGKFLIGGIPTNDELKHFSNKLTRKHLLVIPNFTGDRYSPFNCNFNPKWAQQSYYIAKTFDLPIVIKQKTRTDSPDYKKHYNYILSLYDKYDVDVEIINDTNNINSLIADSACVLSALSTLAFKPIQLNIPTVIINESGQLGNFKNYPYRRDISDNLIDAITEFEPERVKAFIDNTIAGGYSFESSLHYVRALLGVIK